MSDEGSLPLVAILDSNIVVPLIDIKLGENLGVLKVVNKIHDQRKGVCVPDSVLVQVLVVLAGSELAVLVDKEEGGGLQRLGRSDLPRLEMLLDNGFHDFLFIWGKQVDFSNFGLEEVLHVDGVVIGLRGL